VVVPDSKLSLAIGRRGQNVRLAAHLTGYRIDIKSASEYDRLEAEKEAATAVEEPVVDDVMTAEEV
ncbi:transcription termination/antitermination protein NusA, partial [Streptococcus pyogenes]